MATEDINKSFDNENTYKSETGCNCCECCDSILRYAKIPVFVTAAALVLAEGRSIDEISLLAAILTQLGDTLATIATEKGISVEKGISTEKNLSVEKGVSGINSCDN